MRGPEGFLNGGSASLSLRNYAVFFWFGLTVQGDSGAPSRMEFLVTALSHRRVCQQSGGAIPRVGVGNRLLYGIAVALTRRGKKRIDLRYLLGSLEIKSKVILSLGL